ncbi:hypothetical protein [Bifidobacterium longum]|uniref:hypothetical protein n=1 Tax=Bifidobacterium longum TaxID=216816 RepID=UPI00374FC7A3
MCDSTGPDCCDSEDPNLDPNKANCMEGVLDARTLWPEDANELIELADDYPTVEDLGDPYYFDKLRERINRLGLRPDDGHDLEDTLGEF